MENKLNDDLWFSVKKMMEVRFVPFTYEEKLEIHEKMRNNARAWLKLQPKTRVELEQEFKELKEKFIVLSAYDDVYLALFKNIEELFYNVLKRL